MYDVDYQWSVQESMIRCCVALLFLGAVTPCLSAPLSLIRSTHLRGALNESYIGVLSPAEFRKMALQKLSGPWWTVGILRVFDSKRSHSLFTRFRQEDCSLQSWATDLEGWKDAAKLGCPVVQEALKFGGRIVIRSSDRNCIESKEVIQDAMWPGPGLTADGVDVVEMDLTYNDAQSKSRMVHLGVFLRARDRIERAAIVRLVEAMYADAKVDGLSVEVRNDLWFLRSCNFPLIYPFGPRPGPPTPQEFSKTRELGCSKWGQSPVNCFGYGGS